MVLKVMETLSRDLWAWDDRFHLWAALAFCAWKQREALAMNNTFVPRGVACATHDLLRVREVWTLKFTHTHTHTHSDEASADALDSRLDQPNNMWLQWLD